MLVNESQIRALIRLLADEDEKIVRTISGKLIDIGPSAVPLLQEAEIEQPEMADRLVSVLEEIRGGNLEDELDAAGGAAGWSAGSRAGRLSDRPLCLSLPHGRLVCQTAR